MDWTSTTTESGAPTAVLKDGDKVIAKVYLSPDQTVLRVVLPELRGGDVARLKVDYAHGLIDFRRKGAS